MAGGTPGIVEAPGYTKVIGRRIAAHIIDLGICIAVAVALTEFWFPVAPDSWFASGDATALWLPAALVLDWIVLQGLTGFSIGKAVTGIRVVDARGSRPGLVRAVVRAIPLVFEQWGVIGLWAAARNSRNQRFGDRWAKTFVVRGWPPEGLSVVAFAITVLAAIAWIAWVS
ncbi:MAG TPA: RDD family protein [Thermoleophilaceae bacterium]